MLVDPATATTLDLCSKPRDVKAVLRDQSARERGGANVVGALGGTESLLRRRDFLERPAPRGRLWRCGLLRVWRGLSWGFAPDHRDNRADFRDVARADPDLVQPARDDGLDFDRDLIGLDLEEVRFLVASRS